MIKKFLKPVFSGLEKKLAFYVQRLNNMELQTNNDIFRKSRVQIPNDHLINGLISITNVENEGTITIGSGFMGNSGVNHSPIGGDTILRLCVGKGAVLTIGKNVGISNSTIVSCNRITIEDYVMIGGGCKVWDSNFHSLNPAIRTSKNDTKVLTRPVTIREYAFIGGSSIIMKGVTIGRNSVIAAGSVVTESIPDNVIAGGNPCKVLAPLRRVC